MNEEKPEEQQSGLEGDGTTPGGLGEEKSPPQEPIEGIPIPEEVLERMPPPVQESIRETFGVITSGSMGNPIARKVTSEHVTKLIDNSEAESKRDFESETASRRYGMAYVLIAILSFFAFAVLFAESQPELFRQAMAFLATFAAGFAGGWGISTARSSQRE